MPFLYDQVDQLSTLRPAPRRFSPRPSYCRSTVLFLDFDGVLHPEDGLASKRFVFQELDRLEAVLEDYPEVSIVLSTSWQLLSSLDRLKTAFRPEFRDRIEGGTGDLNPESYSYNRGLLAQRWMAKWGKGRRWLSLDDDARAFPYRDDRLLWCSEAADAFGPHEDRLLRAWLETSLDGIQDVIARRVPAAARYWTIRDAVAVAHMMDGWVDVSRVPEPIRDTFSTPGSGTTWHLDDWKMCLTGWRKYGLNPLWHELRDEAPAMGPHLPGMEP